MRRFPLAPLFACLPVPLCLDLAPKGAGPATLWWALSHHPGGGEAALGTMPASGAAPALLVAAVAILVVVVMLVRLRHRSALAVCSSVAGAAATAVLVPMLWRLGPPRWLPGALWAGGLSPLGVIGACLVLTVCRKTLAASRPLPDKALMGSAVAVLALIATGVWDPVVPTVTSSALLSQAIPLRMLLLEALAWLVPAAGVVALVRWAWAGSSAGRDRAISTDI